jgi:protein disulfide-isomerase A1
MNRFVCCLLLAAVAVAVRADDDLAVVTLTKDNFKEVIENNEHVLVEFFAPWCGHCKKLAPEYEKAAKTLKEDGVILGAVDATQDGELASEYGVRGYPTLKLFKNGKASDYGGGRTEDTIVSYIRKKTGPAAKQLADAEAVRAFASAAKVAVVGFFAEASGDEYAAFMAAAGDDDEIQYAYTLDADAAKAEDAAVPSIALYKTFDEGRNNFDGEFTKEAVAEFVGANSVPLVIPFTMDAVAQVFQSKVGKVAFLFSEDEISHFRDVAEKFRGQLVFATTDGSIDRLNSHVGLEKSDFPKLMILETSGQMRKFPLEGGVSEEAITEHIENYLAGKAKPFFKSEPVPEDNSGPVTVIVGKNFDEIVMDESKDVLLEIYAPWCGHCKTLAPIYEELGEAYADNDNIVIAKMDGTANEVEGINVRGFPTLKFFPAGKKTAGGTDYSGSRDLAGFKDFLSKNAKSAPAGEAANAKDEL